MYVADPIERTHCLHITIGLHIAPPPLKYHPCRIFLGKIRFQDYTAEAVIFLKFLIYSWFFSLVYFLSGNHILFTFRLSWSQMSSLKFAFVFMYQNYTYTLTILKSTYTVKLVYKDHPRDQQNVVLIHRWSLYTSFTVYVDFNIVNV